jgi:thiol-disulfide isomerase/thioredoxin
MATELILVYADWCPHCQSFKNSPEKVNGKSGWDTVKSQSKALGFKVTEFDDEAFRKSAPAPLRPLVDGFPTLILQRDGKYYKYQSERSSGPILEFVRSHMSGGTKRPQKKVSGGS